jgi:hypothetical protein
MNSLITAITVSYNTPELLKTAYTSFRRWHPTMKLTIVDGSPKNSECRRYVNSIQDPHITKMLPPKNIGHGIGMHLALMSINILETPFALLFDSDTELMKSPVSAMLREFKEDTYGVGYIEKTGLDGYEYGAHKHHRGQASMRYLHPYFQLISVSKYRQFHPYVHHGAPCYLAMLDLHKRGLGNTVISFPGLGHTAGKGWTWTGNPNLPYVKHDTRGTRDVRLKNGQGEIEPGWILNRGRV